MFKLVSLEKDHWPLASIPLLSWVTATLCYGTSLEFSSVYCKWNTVSVLSRCGYNRFPCRHMLWVGNPGYFM